MALPPIWKIKRELLRFGFQIGKAIDWAKGPTNRRYYDKTLKPQSELTRGAQTAEPNMVVLLLYQPDGLLASTFRQIDYFRSKGMGIIIVSNAPLRADDLGVLQQKCHLVLERPNYGYDFGGYRDGVLLVAEEGLQPDNLFLVNDSMWFPLRADCTLIDTALADDRDAFGIFVNTKSRRGTHHHLQSYFYRFKGRVVADPAFIAVWQHMPLFMDKRLVIRHQEVRMTGRIAALGYSYAALFSPQDIVSAGEKLTENELLEVAKFHASTTPRGKHVFGALASLRPDDPSWTSERTTALHRSRFRYYFIDAHPHVFLSQLKSPFLKKSLEYHFCVQRDELVRLGLDAQLDDVIQAEVRSWNSQGTPGLPDGKSFPRYEDRDKS